MPSASSSRRTCPMTCASSPCRSQRPTRSRRRSPSSTGPHLEPPGVQGHARPDPLVPVPTVRPRRWSSASGASDAVGPDRLRRAGAAVARARQAHAAVAVRLLEAVAEPARRPAAAQALAEGIVLGAYQLHDLQVRAANRPRSSGSWWSAAAGARLRAALEVGGRIAEGVVLARDLVNTPGGDDDPVRARPGRGRDRASGTGCRSACSRPTRSRRPGWAGCSASTEAPSSRPGSSSSPTRPAGARGSRSRWSARASRSTRAACRSRRPTGMTT